MERKESFFRDSVLKLAVPVTLQSLIQASFGVVDQIMTGQLGSDSVAGIGLGGKFGSLYTVIAAAVAAAGSILFSQYIGREEREGVSGTLRWTMLVNTVIGVLFTVIGLAASVPVMSLYSGDRAAVEIAAGYLFITAVGFLPLAWSDILSALFRCHGYAKFPLYASMTSAAANTVLNYFLIFGHGGFPALGMRGAAIATVIGRILECLLLFLFFLYQSRKKKLLLCMGKRAEGYPAAAADSKKAVCRTFFVILLPILVNEFLWGLGENVYAMIYGHIGTDACAAMTLTNPVQSLVIGALTGISSAAGILTGRRLGEGKSDQAYREGRLLMLYGLAGALILSFGLLIFQGLYVQIFAVDELTRELTGELLIVYAVVAPVKVENMILGGGILRSGGKTRIILAVDMIGTWCFGVPLGLLGAFVLRLPVTWVYLMLSLEEGIRLAISLVIFRSGKWMDTIE